MARPRSRPSLYTLCELTYRRETNYSGTDILIEFDAFGVHWVLNTEICFRKTLLYKVLEGKLKVFRIHDSDDNLHILLWCDRIKRLIKSSSRQNTKD